MSHSELLGLPPCKQLFIIGPPGSGKKTLQARVAKILRWKTRRAIDFHSDWALAELRKGELITSARYWSQFFADLQKFLTHMDEMEINLVLAGTFLSRSLRNRLVELGRDQSGRSSNYVVWLKVSQDVARDRLERRLAEDNDAFFQPDWIDRYYTAAQIPEVLEDSRPDERLLRTAEENVFVLDADREEVGIKANFIINRIPQLRDLRWE